MSRKPNGFTLIELAVVLVIIGLLVGGVLLGVHLVRTSESRSAVTQIEQYKTATNTFNMKFQALPGDITALDASRYNLTTRSGAPGHGDGNGSVEGCAVGETVAGCETVLFWVDLVSANLIPGSFSTATDDYITTVLLEFFEPFTPYIKLLEAGSAQAMVPSTPRSAIFPKSSMGSDNYITVFSESGKNYFQLTGIDSTDASGVYTLRNSVSPRQGLYIDSKIDDGFPLLGQVQAAEGTGPLNTIATPGASSCVYNVGSPNPYNVSTSAVDTALCQLRFQFQ